MQKQEHPTPATKDGRSVKTSRVDPGPGNGHREPAPRVREGDINSLNELGEKIFLDRYALKDIRKDRLEPGDLVVVCVNTDTGQREIGSVKEIEGRDVAVVLADGECITRSVEHVDRPVETHPDQMQARVARGIASVESEDNREDWATRFRWLLEGWKFVPGGRILSAAGTDQNLTYYNCYVIPSPHDSRDGIIRSLSHMTEIMSRGGGVGINLSSLRPRYAYVRGVNGRSSGAVSWGSLFSFVTGLIEQGGSRRGALMLILDVWHPDVAEFITAKRTMGRITNANISVGITDDFMRAVEEDGDWDLVFPDTGHPTYEEEWSGDLSRWRSTGRPTITHKTVRARELWESIIESAWASAEPGLWFSERANKTSNSYYYAPLVCTNPCVTGDTLVYTDQGLVPAAELNRQNKAVRVAVDERFGHPHPFAAASPVVCTGHKPVYKVDTREGYTLRATADHRVMTLRGWVEVGKLRSRDRMHVYSGAGAFGREGSLALGLKLGYLLATSCRDHTPRAFGIAAKVPVESATFLRGGTRPDLSAGTDGPKAAPQTVIGGRDVVTAERQERAVSPPTTKLGRLAREHGLHGPQPRVPAAVLRGSRAMQSGFLQALFATRGELDETPGAPIVRLSLPDHRLAQDVQRLLLNFRVGSRVAEHGSSVQLTIHRPGLSAFASSIGFLDSDVQRRLLSQAVQSVSDGGALTATVTAVRPDGTEAVYDLTEPATHAFAANGIVVHNCGEQPLPAWAVCNLGAINLSKFALDGDVDWDTLGTTVRYAVRFLDNVIDATPYFFEENERQERSERRVGLGTMGLAELMIRCGVRYGSADGNAFCEQLYEFIATEAYLASSDIAAEKGSFPMFDADKYLKSGFMQQMPDRVRSAVSENGIRNVTLLTQAPTGSTGTMAGTSTGIEPFYGWTFQRNSRLGTLEERVRVVEEWQRDHPDEDLPDHFVTAMDLTPEEHVSVQAAIQQWVDSSISKTCNVPNSYTVEQTRHLYEYMYELGCKGGTVYRDGSRDEQVLSLQPEEPEAPPEPPEEREVKPRPRQMPGTTYRIVTPLGKAYITLNRNSDGDPFEVFVNLGKAGSDLAADAEAIGRLISLTLRMPSPLSPVERLLAVMEELEGIGGSRTVGFGADRVRSLPDGISHALREDLQEPAIETPGRQLGLLPGADLCPVCGHASFIREEGCQKCYSCGHSEC